MYFVYKYLFNQLSKNTDILTVPRYVPEDIYLFLGTCLSTDVLNTKIQQMRAQISDAYADESDKIQQFCWLGGTEEPNGFWASPETIEL